MTKNGREDPWIQMISLPQIIWNQWAKIKKVKHLPMVLNDKFVAVTTLLDKFNRM
jgi:hypothetical protein